MFGMAQPAEMMRAVDSVLFWRTTPDPKFPMFVDVHISCATLSFGDFRELIPDHERIKFMWVDIATGKIVPEA